MFKNAKHNSILVNSFKKHASWPSNEKVCNSANYKEYTLDQIVTALQFILDNCYVQFAGRIYKQIVGIPMGGNACPFIADLYLSWCEYEYMAKIMKEDVALAKSLNYNSRYMDDIITINFSGFGQLANKIYDPSLILELSSVSGRRDAFLDLYIRIHNNRFYHGIYHKVDDFSFEVISFPFPTSNISKFEGPKCFYSQIIRFARLCNNLQDFQTRLKLTYLKLVKRGYNAIDLWRRFCKFCCRFDDWRQYGLTQGELWNGAFSSSRAISVSANDEAAVSSVVRQCVIRLQDVSCCIDDKVDPYYRNTLIGWMNNNNQYSNNNNSIERPTQEITNFLNYRPVGLSNPKNFCYLNSVIQSLISVLMLNNSEYNRISENQEYRECIKFTNMFFQYEHDHQKYSKRKVESIRQQLKQCRGEITTNLTLDGSIQEDAHECLMYVLQILNKGSAWCLLDDYDDTVDDSLIQSFTKHMFQFMLETTRICCYCNSGKAVQELDFLLNVVPRRGATTQSMIEEYCISHNIMKCLKCKKDRQHICNIEIKELPKILIILLKRFDKRTKITAPVSLEKVIKLNNHKYKILSIIHHHGKTKNSGHYTTSAIYSDMFHCDDNKVTVHEHSTLSASSTAYVALYRKC